MPALTNTNDVIDTFWDKYLDTGIADAVQYVKDQTDGDLSVLETAVPYLVEEARNRDVDIIQFLQELDDLLEKEDATRTDNGGSELPADGDSEAGEPQNEDEPASSRDATPESGSTERSV